jgi:prophage antirepressor-like protein
MGWQDSDDAAYDTSPKQEVTVSGNSNIIPLDYKGGAIRIIEDEGQLWWVAADIARAIDHSHTTNMLLALDDDEKGSKKIATLGGPQNMLCINESGLYTVIMRSNKPEAKPFRRWVTNDVLPAIRKTGNYSTTPQVETRHDKLTVLEKGRSLLLEWNGLDERTTLAINDQVRDIVLEDRLLKGPAKQGRLEVPITDRARQLGYNLDRGQQQRAGRFMAEAYRQKHGKEPTEREQFVDGTTRMVKSYSEADFDLMDDAIRKAAANLKPQYYRKGKRKRHDGPGPDWRSAPLQERLLEPDDD